MINPNKNKSEGILKQPSKFVINPNKKIQNLSTKLEKKKNIQVVIKRGGSRVRPSKRTPYNIMHLA